MKIYPLDLRLFLGLIIAHGLLLFSFHDKSIFWYIFSGSILMLIVIAIYQADMDDHVSTINYLFLGVVSGMLLFCLFWLGRQFIGIFPFNFVMNIRNLYRWYAPSYFWQYIALVAIAAPGEELFWRGFVQKRLSNYLKPAASIIVASLLYSSVNIYSGSFLLVLASVVSGLVWGLLYRWKKSMPLVIVSHIVFDLMIFVILPLK